MAVMLPSKVCVPHFVVATAVEHASRAAQFKPGTVVAISTQFGGNCSPKAADVFFKCAKQSNVKNVKKDAKNSGN